MVRALWNVHFARGVRRSPSGLKLECLYGKREGGTLQGQEVTEEVRRNERWV